MGSNPKIIICNSLIALEVWLSKAFDFKPLLIYISDRIKKFIEHIKAGITLQNPK